MTHALPFIGLYALAGKQLIPAFQKIFTMAASIKYSLSAVEAVLASMGTSEGSVQIQPCGEDTASSVSRTARGIEWHRFPLPGARRWRS
ncbi:MAG: hypothetical protein MZV65_22215 [Chromatiales bacterium]|nr:hypothetical protein [Chromatiales bacterium]